ncbi:SDR family NAD(P)-dependent oxidoreductase [Acrocarpospora catenulata]|uniref:SDR family NAD(P)-dependent oxidoreductase n=1 Tax=Acrocarpospora catenulata TaxID=2836182 RepID=UPI001BD9B386|nr:SDR family oxidoreductase [Acrocarpospora catenulata]
MDGMTLEGRVAVVTGGAGGLGRGIVKDLAAMGATVVVCDINETGAKEVASSVAGGRPYTVDLADPGSIDALTARILADLGRVDVLVNNAGWDKVGPFLQSDPGLWDRIIAINLRAPIQLTYAFLPGMQESGWGRAVFVSSDAARVGSTGEAVYASCKAGLIGFAKTIARESARSGVTSNVVCPGPSDTPLLAEVAAGSPKLVEALKRSIPVGRLGAPRDVAGAVAFLASERAEYITGQTLSVSGGLTMV